MTKGVAEPDRPCKFIPEPTDAEALVQGEWVIRNCIRVWVEHKCGDCGGYLAPNTRCDICLTWAVKNARDTEWARMSRANRHVIWNILDARNHRELMSA